MRREDLRGLPLQVGPFHAMYSDGAGWISYDRFRITVPAGAGGKG